GARTLRTGRSAPHQSELFPDLRRRAHRRRLSGRRLVRRMRPARARADRRGAPDRRPDCRGVSDRQAGIVRMTSGSTLEIRPARPDDAARLAVLRWEFRAGRATPTEDQATFVARCTSWMTEALAAGEWRAWVAVVEGRIAGQIWLHTITKVPNPVDERERHAYISNLYVTPPARGGV